MKSKLKVSVLHKDGATRVPSRLSKEQDRLLDKAIGSILASVSPIRKMEIVITIRYKPTAKQRHSFWSKAEEVAHFDFNIIDDDIEAFKSSSASLFAYSLWVAERHERQKHNFREVMDNYRELFLASLDAKTDAVKSSIPSSDVPITRALADPSVKLIQEIDKVERVEVKGVMPRGFYHADLYSIVGTEEFVVEKGFHDEKRKPLGKYKIPAGLMGDMQEIILPLGARIADLSFNYVEEDKTAYYSLRGKVVAKVVFRKTEYQENAPLKFKGGRFSWEIESLSEDNATIVRVDTKDKTKRSRQFWSPFDLLDKIQDGIILADADYEAGPTASKRVFQ